MKRIDFSGYRRYDKDGFEGHESIYKAFTNEDEANIAKEKMVSEGWEITVNSLTLCWRIHASREIKAEHFKAWAGGASEQINLTYLTKEEAEAGILMLKNDYGFDKVNIHEGSLEGYNEKDRN